MWASCTAMSEDPVTTSSAEQDYECSVLSEYNKQEITDAVQKCLGMLRSEGVINEVKKQQFIGKFCAFKPRT